MAPPSQTATVKTMAKAFRPGDVRRVEAAFEEVLPAEYAAEITLSRDRKTMTVVVMDPDNPEIYVVNAQFDFNEKPMKGLNNTLNQPPDAEVMRIAGEFAHVCTHYPAAKAKQDAEQLFKSDFAERKEQFKADEEAQAARDKLLLRTDAEEEAAMAQDAESR